MPDGCDGCDAGQAPMTAIEINNEVQNARHLSEIRPDRVLSLFERCITFNAPVLESLLLQLPTDSIFKLYQTSHYLRTFFRSYPTAWKSLSFRLLYPSAPSTPAQIILPGTSDREAQVQLERQSRPYALDQLLMNVLAPFTTCLRSLELDNTAVSGQILVSTVMHARCETLEHLSIRGCKHVSLKYHIVPYLNLLGLQQDIEQATSSNPFQRKKRLALKSLYAYRSRHHRRRPYLASSIFRKDSDAEPTHELVNLCHKLGIWTDTAWCTTPAGRCFRRRGYVAMRDPQGTTEAWVAFDRLWRSKNWIGPYKSGDDGIIEARSGRLWESEDTGCFGEALGSGDGPEPGEGKMVPAHLRRSHRQFVEDVKCDNCGDEILERCEQCSILMHCVGCRKTLCASCAYERPYLRQEALWLSSNNTHHASAHSHNTVLGHHSTNQSDPLWWAPGAVHSPSSMEDPVSNPLDANTLHAAHSRTPDPVLKFHWCCAEPYFSGGGGISIGTPSRDVDQVRAVPLPRNQGWEDLEYTVSEWSKTFPKYAYGDPSKPDYTLETGHLAMMKWLLGPPGRKTSPCPRNLCQECYDSPQWKVHCKSCSKPLCIEHDLRGLRLRICGYKELGYEKLTIQNRSAVTSPDAQASQHMPTSHDLPIRTQDFVGSTNSSYIDGPSGDVLGDALVDEEQSFETPNDHGVTRPPFPRTPTRSFSAPPSSNSGCSSPLSSSFESTLEGSRWQGCQSFFCPTIRAAGDRRQTCPSYLRQCKECAVFVCQDCVQANPPCKCPYCQDNYKCPNCVLKNTNPGGPCRHQEDEKARKERKWKRDMQELEKILQLKLANEVAEFAGQFFCSLENDHVHDHAHDLDYVHISEDPIDIPTRHRSLDEAIPTASHEYPSGLIDMTMEMEPGLFIDPDDLPPPCQSE